MKEKDNKWNWKKGSSTIEAAFLIPMILTIVVLFIYLSFFLYNRVILTETSYIAALRGSQMEGKSAQEIYTKADQAQTQLLNGKLLAVSSYEKQIEVTGKKIQVKLKLEQKIPFSGLIMPFLGKDSWEFSVEKSAKEINPYEFIRDCRRILK